MHLQSIALIVLSSSLPISSQSAINYTIKPGDTLSGIAAKYGTTVSALTAANPSITDPHKIYAGNTIKIPTTTTSTYTPMTYTTTPFTTTPTTTTSGSFSSLPLTTTTTSSGSGGSSTSNADLISSLMNQANQLQNQLNILKQAQAASGGKITDTSQIPPDVLSGKADLSAYLASLSQPKEPDSVTMLKDLLAKSQQSYTDLLSKLQSQPTATQTYEDLANKLGLSSKQAQMDAVAKQLKDLEDNINARASGMGLSEPLRQRLLAAEQRPLYKTYTGLVEDVSAAKENLSTLLNLAAQDKAYATQLAQLPLQSLQAQIPLYTALAEAASKLTPQQELQNAIAKAQAEQAIKGYSTIDTGSGIYQWNPDTKAYDIYVGPSKTSESGNNINYLTIDGQVYRVVTDKYGNEISRTSLGTAGAAKEDTTAAAKNIVSLLSSSVNKLNLGKDPASAIKRGIELTGQSYLKTNTDAAAYKSLVDGTVSMIIRGLGEKGVLTEQDVSRAYSLIPSFFDTKDVANKKIEQLKQLIEGASGATSISSTSTTDDPLGLFK